MPQKTDIILGIQAKIIDTVFELADPFDPHAEGKSRILITVDTEVVQHFGMHHPAAEDLDPTGVLAHTAADAAADPAIDVHFGAGFGKRKIRRAEADLYVFSEHFLYEEVQRLLQVRERNVLVDV